ncbi:calmin-like isoform X1 [Carcharodon carcharias]|uniref:calmin-like isoform X1 n=2 Tax=Carcharodon carcharias TaxID=13397 RepID=UPI001B7E22A6|nr:calmin-like isoform X1 [Carcharodon carcharias]
MAGLEWDWFQREELIGHISDIRVQNLQVERVSTQKRTFTRWINFHLDRCNPPLEVKDLFQDMKDGKILMALLEVLSGQRLMQHYKHSMHRIFRLNNIAKALQFLEEGYVKLVSIDAPEIANGNPSMILGLIWNIILHFQIKEATGHLKIFSPTSSLSSLHSGSDNDLMLHCTSKETTPSAPYKDQRKVIKVLLNWVQRRTAKYGVAIQDFGTSWRSGIAFLALIKAIDPGLVDMRKAMERQNKVNLEDAFKIAHVNLDIPPLLEPEDVDVEHPEEQSITTYVSQFLEHFPDIDENNAAEDAYESPFEDSHVESAAMSSDLGARNSHKMHIEDIHHALENSSPALQDPEVLVRSHLKDEKLSPQNIPVKDNQPLHKEDDYSLVIQDSGSVEREMVTTPFIDVSNINNSNTSLHQDSQSTSSDLHNGSLKPASDANATDTVEEIYVLLRPVKRKSSTGEKIMVSEKEPSSPVPYDHYSPVAADDVLKVGSRVEIPQSFAKDLCDSSLEISTEKENTCSCNTLHEDPNDPQDQYLSLYHVGNQTSASMPSRSRNISELCTQTDEKPSRETNELLPSVINNAFLDDEKVSVIPLNLVYYPHYEVPVSKVLEAFSVTGSPQKELVPEFQHHKDLSPLDDEAYQSCSELSNSLSLQELSPTFSEKTLCTPNSDQIYTLNNLNHPEAGENAQAFSSFQGTELSQFIPVAIPSAPSERILTSIDKLPEQPVLEAMNEQLEDKFSVKKYGDLQMPKREHEKDQEKNSAGTEVLGDQLLDLLPSVMGPKETGEDVGSYDNGSELPTDTIDKQHIILQSTAISSSTTLVNTENLREKNIYDVLNSHKYHNQESLLKAVDERCSSDSDQHASNQDNVELLVQPTELVQDEHCPDPKISSLTGQDETQQKVSESLLLNEAKITDETHLRTRLAPQSDNASVLEAMWHPAAIVIHDKAPPGSPDHPQLPYLILLLWMVVYWLIILLHLDMESLGQFTSS